jgi:hypothetical protein
MKPQGVWADLVRTRFRIAKTRLGLIDRDVDLDITQFARRVATGKCRCFRRRFRRPTANARPPAWV